MGSRSPDKSPTHGPKAGVDKKDSRLLAFHNISKNQFRQNAPLTVKRSSSGMSGSDKGGEYAEGEKGKGGGSPSLEGGRSPDKKPRRVTTLSVTPASSSSSSTSSSSSSPSKKALGTLGENQTAPHSSGGRNSPNSRPIASMTMTMVQSWGGPGGGGRLERGGGEKGGRKMINCRGL